MSYYNAIARQNTNMSTQQCTRLCKSPSREHKEDVNCICIYMMRTKDKVLVLRPYKQRGLYCYVDADWVQSWQDRPRKDSLSSYWRTGYIIMFVGCPIVWLSKMKHLIELSTSEAEYISISAALHEVIAVNNLLYELHSRI